MTLSAGTVSIGVKSDTKGFGAKLREGIMGESSGLGALGSHLGGLLVAGLGVAGIAVGVGEIFKTGFSEAMAAENLNAQFTAGIKSTGNAAHLNIKTMDDLAASVAGYSGQTYESIGSTEKILQTFTNIKNSGPNKIFDQATEAAANMAAKLGGDASQQAIRLGIALQDPEKGVAKLMRVGVAFTDSQKLSIKTMVAHGNVMGAQKIILGELQTEFGGAAKAAGGTLAGSLARTKVAFGEVSKSVVEGILPIVTPAIQGIANGLTKAMPSIKAFSEAFAVDLTKGIHLVTPLLTGLWQNVIVPVANFIRNTVIPAISDLWSGFSQGTDKLGSAQSTFAVFGAVLYTKVMPIINTIAKYVKTDLIPAFEKVGPVLLRLGQAIVGNVLPVINNLVNIFTTHVLPVILQVRSYIEAHLLPIFMQIAGVITQQVLPTVGKLAAWFTGTLVPAVLKIVEVIGKNLKPVFDAIVNAVQSQVIPAVKALIAKFEEWRPTIEKVIGVVVQVVGKVLEFAAAILGKVLPPIIKFAGFLIGTLFSAIGTVIGVVVSIIGHVVDFGTAIYNAGATVVNFASNVISNILGLRDKIVGALSGAAGWLVDTGKNIIHGLVNGVKSMASWLGNAILSLIPGPIKNIVKSALGINSPSTVFAEFGKNTVQGFIVGVEGHKKHLTSTMSSLVSVPRAGAGSMDFASSSARSSAVSGSGGGATLNIQNYNEAHQPPDQVAADFAFRMRTA